MVYRAAEGISIHMLTDKVRLVLGVAPLVLCHDMPRRESPRDPAKRQPGYDEQFDADTLAYDVFAEPGGTRVCGPPLLNLLEGMQVARWTLDGASVAAQLTDLDRTQASILSAESMGGEKVAVVWGGKRLSATVSPSQLELFEGRKVLVSKSRNNRLHWITDWARFHAVCHGVDAVLLYDNGSTDYKPSDVLKALDIPELDVAVVVNWPFRFGPQGGLWTGMRGVPWDSDFCEYGILEHARHRFLARSATVLHQDIDELVVTHSGASVFDVLAKSGADAIRYSGRWIENINIRPDEMLSYRSFVHIDVRKAPTTQKWALNSARAANALQWKTHQLAGIQVADTNDVAHRHFMGLTTNWKWDRLSDVTYDPAVHIRDSRLIRDLMAVFGPESTGLTPSDEERRPTARSSRNSIAVRRTPVPRD